MDGARHEQMVAMLVELARALSTEPPVQVILNHLASPLGDILPVAGAGLILLGEHDELLFASASSARSSAIAELQHEVQHGPCMVAHRTGKPAAIIDTATDTHFPHFAALAHASGFSAVFSFPIRADAHPLGVLELYRDVPGPLSGLAAQAAVTLAEVAAAYVSNAQARIATSATVGQLSHRSLHDPLTELPNRVLLEELLERSVARARRSQHVTAVLFADLDGFKAVNDNHGHHFGDQLLVATADRLRSVLRPGDTLARLAGDEFVVVCEDLHDSSEAEIVAKRITTVMSLPFEINMRQVTVTVSVGIAFSGPGQDLPEELLQAADFAMYEAKSEGGGRHLVVNPQVLQAVEERNALDRDLRQAHLRGELDLVYQPVVDIPTGALIGAEALLRWNSPVRGTVLPAVILPSAERTGLIPTLDEWLCRQACEGLRRWQRDGVAAPGVTVSVSPAQVLSPAFVPGVARVLAETQIDPRGLCFAVNESLFHTDAPRAGEVLRAVKSLGVLLAVDGFGTGNFSLNYLRDYPFDVVKIDPSCTATLAEDELTRCIVRAIVEVSHALGITVVATGADSPHQLAAVAELGVEHAQGLAIAEPMSHERVLSYLSDSAVTS